MYSLFRCVLDETMYLHTEIVYSITKVHLLLSVKNKHECRDTSMVQGPPCVFSQSTTCAISYSDREVSFLAVLSWMVSDRNLLPFLYPTYCHTPPQHSSPLSLQAHCCLATSSLAQYDKSTVTDSLSSNMADRKMIALNDLTCKGSNTVELVMHRVKRQSAAGFLVSLADKRALMPYKGVAGGYSRTNEDNVSLHHFPKGDI